jgi:hypothetical protein
MQDTGYGVNDARDGVTARTARGGLTSARSGLYPSRSDMKRLLRIRQGPLAGLVLLAATIPQVACDTFEPTWFAIDDRVLLHSLARVDFVGLASAYDFVGQRPVVVEAPKLQDPYDFDIAVTEINGEFHVMPAGMFEGFPIQPGIVADSSGITFDQLTRAPRDGYVTDRAIPLRLGWVYAVRTRRDFRGCNMYGKFEVLALDPAGIVELRAIRNPLCNDRNLVPPGD